MNIFKSLAYTDETVHLFNSLLHRQNIDLLKWKAFAGKNSNVAQRRNCLLRAISPFPTVFSKELNCRPVKTRACLGKG